MDDDIYYVDDPRNASRDHRVSSGGTGFGRTIVPRFRPPAVANPPAYAAGYPTNVPAAMYQQPMYQQPMYQQWFPQGLFPQGNPMYQQPATAGSFIGTLFGRVTLGQIAEIGATLVAAFQRLPTAPKISDDPAANTANAIIYQEALAEHAKRDEHIRAFGTTAARLLT